MFEAHVLHLLRKYLGEYVHGLSAEALRISVWKGDVVLKDLKLKAEALNSLKLPVTVKAGFVGTITLKVPWKSLGKEPVIVLIDRVFVLVHPVDGRTLQEEDREKLFEAKLQQIEEAESATLEATSKSKLGTPPAGNSWLGSLIATIIGNLKISICNVHIRYEDSLSNAGHPFSAGITLAKLAAVTMDEQGNETFDTSGALDKLRKSLQLERLAMYHNSNSISWKIEKNWEDLSPKEWVEIFEDGINKTSANNGKESTWALNRNYLVSPINGVLKYHRLGNQERHDPEVPFEKASLLLNDVSLTLSEAQYYDWIKLLEVVSRYKTYVEVSHLRPLVPVSQDPFLWWRYAAQAGLQQKKMCYRFSWDRIHHLCQLRRRYVQLYAGLLQQVANVDVSEIREIERDLDSKVILLWRLLGHVKVETVKSKEAAQQRKQEKKSWFSLGWRSSADNASAGDISEGSLLKEDTLTKEEWQAINNILRCQPDEEWTTHSGNDVQNMIQFLVTVSIGQAAARIVSINQTELVCGRFEQLHVSTKFKQRSIQCDVLLKFYGLSAPEGTLAQSVSSEQKENALAASFVHLPVGENVDWKLSATISPCHVTVLMESYERFLEFVKRSNAVSPTIALETATALQMKIEKVTRRAQEQFQMVLEEQSRFALDIDFDAPKVRIPIRACAISKCDSHFLLDLGHFTLHTKESNIDDKEQNLFSHFYISGRDIAAFFSVCDSNYEDCILVAPATIGQSAEAPLEETGDNFYSLIDRCRMAVAVDQIKVPHPSYPSTRISIQVPSLGIHFSTARYLRLMELLNIFYGTTDTNGNDSNSDNWSNDLVPWNPPDLATSARILVWKGIGYSVASWQPCFLVLSGLYLYVLENEKSQNYQRCSSMAGRQVQEVPAANVGGSPFCIAVCFRGMDIQKALESSSTWVIELRDEVEKAIWIKELTRATYQASAPASVNVHGESDDVAAEFSESLATNRKAADLVINGALVETKLLVYGKTGEWDYKTHGKPEESLILEFLAGGGKVHIVQAEGDLAVKMKVHSLQIKDELQGPLAMHGQYLARSVLKNEHILSSPHISESKSKDLTAVLAEEDDIFRDALTDFMSFSVPKVGDFNDCLLPQYDEAFNLEREEFYEAHGSDNSDFVSVTFSTKSPNSPDYDGIDTQMSIRMSKLEFFCNRPTLVALIDFGLDLSSVNSGLSSNKEKKNHVDDSLLDKEKIEDNGRAFVTGLLGYGKARVVFNLNMNVDSVSVFLNKEDDTQLAMFVQESFLLDVAVHPSSLSIEGTLGNFRLCDMSLGIDHRWGWLCDIRNPGVESLIKFTFNSYSAHDDDYEGHDYSLCGRLSAVRIVFLYRFVQEITAYFMELAAPHTEEAIKLVDRVGGLEWLIQKYEMDGASALKLDLSLDTPIIIVPRNSMGNDFIQLDLGQLQVINEFSWHGSPDKDPSAVHIDVLHAKILGISMSVGVEGCIGKTMIREGQGLDVYVRRTLRDVFRKVPTLSLEIKVGLLHAVMSDKEYNVILDCASMNLNEEPILPRSFRDSKSGSKDTMKLLADKVNTNSQVLLSRTVTIVEVEVNYALLELCNNIHKESTLAHIILDGVWVSYRMTSLSETDLYITIPKFSIVDIRPDTKPEMRLMLGSSTDASKQLFTGSFPIPFKKGSFARINSESTPVMDAPNSTMFLMDYRWRSSSQSYVVRVQEPRVLVVPDFLLAVGEFFVPALGAITGREEAMDSKNDPLSRNNRIVLSEPVFKQSEDVVRLSPSRQLVADAAGVDEYTYDGCGGTICLNEENDLKERPVRRTPIIIIGRGKRLRFTNVKIENGSLLKKYTHLSNNSSYSASTEDGVNIILVNNSDSEQEMKRANYTYESTDTSGIAAYSPNDSTKMRSFTFEAQVVSPEFTFYDGTKSSLDDSLYGEKLLRAKMDLSFMYASKEDDTWVRALIKDLLVESGSGLVILDPVDISGGYTSVKDRTNISLISTDICIHLSLSVISLILNLQSQVLTALQFGNSNPLALCTNFEKVWVSQKDNVQSNNLTFWRPRAPSNYVILGDCVTSGPIPPSQAVMAVSNTYGRVRKPLGFRLIASYSGIQVVGQARSDLDTDCKCSIWIPVAPSGYTAMGCVAYIGSQPPPNHIVYCIRSDLVTSSVYLECMFCDPSNLYSPSGFSIWRLDNVIGSFYAQTTTTCPTKESAYDFSHILLLNSNRDQSSPEDSTYDMTADHDLGHQQQSNERANSSGWDILRSISRASNCYVSTPHFERIWWDKGDDIRRPVSIWRPVGRPGYTILGDCITEGFEPPALGIIFKADNPEISAKPVQFTKVAHIIGKGLDEVFFWYPVAPPGYASLGCIVSRTDEAPTADYFCCPRIDLVSQAPIFEVPIARSSSMKASHCWGIWKIENQACTFLARSDLKKPSSRLAYSIVDAVKPKSQENITVDMKLRCFSLTVLDSLCGMMTPIFDTTITNIKLATHGQPEAMNAVLISSVAASTFNPQLEAWEPLIEPFDGIFKFETYDTNVCPPYKLGKRVRVAATSILNVNVSAASLDTFVETITSWRRQIELEQKAKRLNEEVSSRRGREEDTTFFAVGEDEFQTVILENKLGCDIYLKKAEENTETVELLHHENCVSVRIPPQRFLDRMNVADVTREARYYVAVHIFEAKVVDEMKEYLRGLRIVDDGNSHKFFCALRLVVDSHVIDQQKLFPQSARTKCVKPIISKTNDVDEGKAKWNELFIFEVPRKGLAKLELEVTNLAAKAGKGEVVGAFSFSVGHGANTLKKVASARMLHQSFDMQNAISHPLMRRGQVSNDEYGRVLVSTTYFERKTIIQRDTVSDSGSDRDAAFWVGLDQEGKWESFRSLLPLSVIPKTLNDNFVGVEIVMKNAKKRAIIRGLATIVNESDVELDFSLCHISVIHTQNNSSPHNTVVEEIFENQCCQSTSGWASKRASFHNSDPGQWSTRDFSYSSKDFFEPSVPPGWQWVSTWTVDKSQSVDVDGWAYGPDYQSLKWPPTSSKTSTKSAVDAVRRRRWVRTRQQYSGKENIPVESICTTISPGSSFVLPWKSTFRNSDQCLLIRPSGNSPAGQYSWGRAIAVGSGNAFGKDQQFADQGSFSRQSTNKHGNKAPNFSFKLNELEKKDLLMYCSPSTGNKQFWLSAGADATILHTELNVPVYDWKISVNSPLKLENRLPCCAEFTIWEKTGEASSIERQRGVISSRKSVHIYTADVQKALYLSLFLQGGWVLEKDSVLILDLLSNENVSSFWMIHQQSKRRLRVSMECDMGGTVAAPKTIRFFVSYWIVNDSSVSLAYRLVEIEPLESADIDSPSLSRAAKSAKTAKIPARSMERRHISSVKNIHVLEIIEDTTPTPSMLSPQDYANRSGATLFLSRKGASLSPRLAIAVAVHRSENYSPGISLVELENKERVDVKAFRSDGLYYKLSALLNMTSDRTKVIHFQPHTLFINRLGCRICLQQCNSQSFEWIQPTDSPKPFGWQSSAKVELLKLRLDGYNWSTAFSVHTEGLMCVSLKNDAGNEHLQLRVEVRSGTKRSRYEVIFRPTSFSSPYRIENRSMFLPLRFRQVDGSSDSWKSILPNSASSFAWEDLGRELLLELLVDGTDTVKSAKYNIDEPFDHLPISVPGEPARPLRVTILKEDKANVIKITDWMPENEPSARSITTSPSSVMQNDSPNPQSQATSNCEFHVIIELAELGLSIVDHTPEEILYLSVQNLLFSHSSGLESGISRFKLRMRGIQVDNQLPLTPMPVLFRPQRVGDDTDHLLKFSMTLQSNGSPDLCVYPYIGFHGPEKSSFSISIHEPIIWRLHEMIQQVNFSRIHDTHKTDVSVVDSIIQIGVLNISEVRFKVSMSMSPTQRPRGVLGFWSSLMTALGNTENMPIRINQRFHQNICMRQSAMVSNAISNIQKDLLGQPLQLLSGVDILGNASSALGHMSKGVAALSMDKKFIQSRQKQESKGVEDLGSVIRGGGGAFAKGLFRGVTGIVTKPLEGAKSSGVEGFVQGFGKGIIGVAAQPVSGVLDLLSKTTEGANAVRMKIAAAITSDEQLLRRRLPRVIGGDNLLRPYDEYKAQGQVILQLAESGSFFGQVDLFRVRGKFALSDAYEDHFLLPKARILVVTHRRLVLLQQPTNIIAQRKFSPAKDPCSVLWDVLWDNLMTMELTNGRKEDQNAPPSRLILYLRCPSTELKDQVRLLKCNRDSHQAVEVFSSIELARKTYGPNLSKEKLKKKVEKPYSPKAESVGMDVILEEAIGILGPQQVPTSVPVRSTFGSSSNSS